MARNEKSNQPPNPDGSENSAIEWFRDYVSSPQIAFVPDGVPAHDLLSCPHCNSECSTDELTPGIFETTVYHDDSCPWLAQLHQHST